MNDTAGARTPTFNSRVPYARQVQRTSRWAIIGTGDVSRQFVAGLRSLDGAEPALVISRDPATAERFAAANRVARSAAATTADEIAAVVTGSAVDIVYIASPASEHERHALAAIAAGTAVVVEKPFTVDAASAERVVNAARAAEVFCMEAMWTRFLPLVTEIHRLVATGALGEPRSMTAAFLGADVPDAGQGIFDPARGGGALLHRGVYGVSLARHLLGPVSGTTGTLRFGDTGVDEDNAVVLQHSSGAISAITSSLRTADRNGFSIHGTEATLHVSGPIYRPNHARLTPVVARRGGMGGARSAGRLATLRQSAPAHAVRQRAGAFVEALRPPRARTVRRPYRGNGYQYEAEAVGAALMTGRLESTVMPLDETVEIMRVLDRARANQTERGTTG